MKPLRIYFVGVTLVCSTGFFSSAEESAKLSVVRSATGVELSWSATVQAPDGLIIRPYFELQRSTDLLHWQPIGERLRAATPTPGQSLSALLTLGEPRAFYRLLSVAPQTSAGLGTSGADVFGYGPAFAQELQRIGQISFDQFAAMFPPPTNYMAGISWDPITAKFWDQFNADPAVVNSNKNWGDPGYRSEDYRLYPQELVRFRTNGFVVSERLGFSGVMTCLSSFRVMRYCKRGIARMTRCSRNWRRLIFSIPSSRSWMAWRHTCPKLGPKRAAAC
jgi:hypothetical protein